MVRSLQVGIAAVLLAFVSRAAGQEQYTLSEDDQWTRTRTLEPGSPEFQLHQARLALAEGRADRAAALATQWIERNAGHDLMPEAYLVRGDALRADREYYEALFDYEYIARVYPGSEAFITALERELEIALQFASGTRRRLWGLPILDASDEAEELFIRIQERLPGSRIAEQAGMALGDFYFERRAMDMAATVYDLFIENYPDSDQVGKARRRLIWATFAQFKGPEFDASALLQARAQLRTLREVDPSGAQQVGAEGLLARVDESLAEKLFTAAQWYERVGDVISAEMSIRRLVLRYPRTVAAAQAVRWVQGVTSRLPPAVLREAPDYAAILRGEFQVAPPPDIVEPEPVTPSATRRPGDARPEELPPERPQLSPEAVEEKP
jgi:outer membrane protein assembly factor BamD (BamD/ComL family)